MKRWYRGAKALARAIPSIPGSDNLYRINPGFAAASRVPVSRSEADGV